MHRLVWETPEEIDLALAKRVSGIRKRRGISQKELSERCGVSYGSIKRFETTGLISFLSLTKIAMELEMEGEIRGLFSDVPYQSIQEVINENK